MACSWVTLAAVAVMTTSAPAAAGQLHDPLDDVDLGAVDHLVGLHGVRAHLQPLGVHVDQEDLADLVHAAGDPDVHAADRAGTEDDEGVALLDAQQLLGVDRAGEGLGGRRLVVADVVRDPVQAVDLEHLLRHDHVLGEAAVVLVADRGLVRADGHPALAALVALPARHRGDDLHPVPRCPAAAVGAVDVGPDLDDLAGDLVADRPRRGEVLVPVVEDLDVGAAGGAVLHLELDLVRPAGGLGDVLEADVLRGVEPQCLHRDLQWCRDGLSRRPGDASCAVDHPSDAALGPTVRIRARHRALNGA